MNALLLAGGYGTRLRPLTDKIPKCLMPVGGKPLLQIWLERLDQAGIDNFLVNTHYLAEQVEQFIDQSRWRNRVQLAHEEKLLGTAGTLVRYREFFGMKDGLLVHADNLCLADFEAFSSAHHNRPAGTCITMMTFRTDDPSSCGIVETDSQEIMQAFHEKQADPPSNLANGAVYLLSLAFLDELRTQWAAATDFSTEILPSLNGRVFTWETPDSLVDIGTPKRYLQACQLLELKELIPQTI